MKIFLMRHASPDWDRKDIPYDIPPGPPLTAKGEKEAVALANFLKSQNVTKLYYSPFERSAKTAQIIAALNGIPCQEEQRLREWRERDENECQVKARMMSMIDFAVEEINHGGSIGLVSHGGPIALLLLELGIENERLLSYRKRFDHANPLPPAGAWEALLNDKSSWELDLKFIPLES